MSESKRESSGIEGADQLADPMEAGPELQDLEPVEHEDDVRGGHPEIDN